MTNGQIVQLYYIRSYYIDAIYRYTHLLITLMLSGERAL